MAPHHFQLGWVLIIFYRDNDTSLMNLLLPSTPLAPMTTQTSPTPESKSTEQQHPKIVHRPTSFTRNYHCRRRQVLNEMAKEYGVSVRKVEQIMKETKKYTGVDLLSNALKGINNQQGNNHNVKEALKFAKTLQQSYINGEYNTLAVLKLKAHPIPAAQIYLAQRCQQPSSSSLVSPQSQASSQGEKSEDINNGAATTTNTHKHGKVTTPDSSNLKTPPPLEIISSSQASTATQDADQAAKEKKSKHNQHNKVYRDKLKKDKRRYEQHKEKARLYNEKRRKKLRAMAKETGLTLKEMEKTISEAKIISALTVTASKEAEKFQPVPVVVPSYPSYGYRRFVPHLIGMSPCPQPRVPDTNCLGILSDAASIVLSKSQVKKQGRFQCADAITSSPRRQHRAVSEDNSDAPVA